MPRATIYGVIKWYLNTKSIVHRSGSGRLAKKITREEREALRSSVNHKTGLSQCALARKVSKSPNTRMRWSLKRQRRDTQKCRKNTKPWIFVVDDENYFGLSGFQMSGNRSFYTSDLSKTPIDVATYIQ